MLSSLTIETEENAEKTINLDSAFGFPNLILIFFTYFLVAVNS